MKLNFIQLLPVLLVGFILLSVIFTNAYNPTPTGSNCGTYGNASCYPNGTTQTIMLLVPVFFGLTILFIVVKKLFLG